MHALSAAPLVGRGPSSSHTLSGQQQQQQLSLREAAIPYRRPASRGVLLRAGGSGRPEGSSLATSVWGVLPSALLPAGLQQAVRRLHACRRGRSSTLSNAMLPWVLLSADVLPADPCMHACSSTAQQPMRQQ